MTLTRPRTRCYASEEQALASKLGRSGDYETVRLGDGWHLQRRLERAPQQRKAPKDTGPTPAVRALVLARDGYACARCGKPCGPGIAPYSLQHRVARGVGGDSRASNLVLLDGTATTGCHGEVEARRDPRDQECGYRLESWQDPRLVGVMYHERDGSGITRWLEDDGGVLLEAPEGAECVA